jgi:hypothetical protein
MSPLTDQFTGPFFWGKPSREFQEPPLHRLGLVGQHDMFDFSVGVQEIWAKFFLG